ncbi:MAG: S1C family serine protease [Aureliella sp.]
MAIWQPNKATAQPPNSPATLGSVADISSQVERNLVKLYGAGGYAGLDSYQSGVFISPEGYILTVWSTVLDVNDIIAVSSDGSRYVANIVGIDPNLEIAVLKTNKAPASSIDLQGSAKVEAGERVLAFSNLFGIASGTEMSSVQKGVVMAVTNLDARRGSLESVYDGPVYLIDAMTNNPGAAGGLLTNFDGRPVALLGKELRDSAANIWVNYAVPLDELKQSIGDIISGKTIVRKQDNRKFAARPINLNDFGVALVPNVLAKTPAYVDLVQPGSKAMQAGIQHDDLILFVNSTRVASQEMLLEELQYIDRADQLILLVQRGGKLQEIILNQ